MSKESNMSTFTTIAMPSAKAPAAPHFSGTRVEDFLEEMEACGRAAGITTDELPSYVFRYCSQRIRDQIEYLPQLKPKPESRVGSWDRLKARLIELFRSQDKRRIASPEKLKAFTKDCAAKDPFRSRADVDRYELQFMAMADPLKASRLITDNEYNLRFYRGLPTRIRERIRSKLDSPSQSNPPKVEDTLKLVRALYAEDDIDAPTDEEYEEPVYSDEERSDDYDEPVVVRAKRIKVKPTTRFQAPEQVAEPIDPATEMANLREQMARMQLSVNTLTNSRRPPTPTQTPTTPPAAANVRCWVCEQHGAHAPGVRFCPEVGRLMAEKLVKFAPGPSGVLIRFNGDPIQYPRPGDPGLGQMLRAERAAGTKETPPHLASSAVGLVDGNRDVLQGDVYAVSAEENWMARYTTEPAKSAYDSNPVTRSGKNHTDTRYDPKRKPEPKTGPSPTAVPAKPQPARFSVRVPVVEPSQDLSTHPDHSPIPGQPPVAVPPPAVKISRTAPPHPSNTEEGWKNARKYPQKGRQDEGQDVEMTAPKGFRPPIHAAPPPPKGKDGTYRFTSNVQESTDFDRLQSDVLDTRITLSLRDLLGSSAELQKRFATSTKVRREYGAKSADYWVEDNEEMTINECSNAEIADNDNYGQPLEEGERTLDGTGEAFMTFRPDEDSASLYVKYASLGLVTTPKPSRYFAMATGRFTGTFAGREVTFMVDTGSELNLIPSRIYEQTSLPLDADGSRWSLRGIHGDPVPLTGCCRNVPILVGGHRFDHHFFVSSEETGKQDVILGQPWLEWYCAMINYLRGGNMEIVAYPDGSRKGAAVSIRVAGIETGRNQDRLNINGVRRASDEDFSP